MTPTEFIAKLSEEEINRRAGEARGWTQHRTQSFYPPSMKELKKNPLAPLRAGEERLEWLPPNPPCPGFWLPLPNFTQDYNAAHELLQEVAKKGFHAWEDFFSALYADRERDNCGRPIITAIETCRMAATATPRQLTCAALVALGSADIKEAGLC